LVVANNRSNTVSVMLGKATTVAVATPVFNPNGGAFDTSVTVTITDSTPGATIYYTTDGSAPTPAGTVYTGPITLPATTTLKALAVAPGNANRSAASETD